MMITNDELKINTIYIISKGRPQCKTAETLKRMKYPGEWFIVCGNNDETLPQYQEKWGDKVLIFDWYDEIKRTNTLDNFGFEKVASGACPVRNAVRRISAERGEKRHWQFDDDYSGFSRYDGLTGKNKAIKDGRILYSTMYRIAEFAYKTGVYSVGLSPQEIQTAPPNRYQFNRKTTGTHNMPSSEDGFVEWVGRGSDDFINTFNAYKAGKSEFAFMYVQFSQNVKGNVGGLEQFNNFSGALKRFAYVVMVAPIYSRIVLNKRKDGSFYLGARMSWAKAFPKLLSEKYRKIQKG